MAITVMAGDTNGLSLALDKEIKENTRKAIQRAVGAIRPAVAAILRKHLENSPTIQGIKNGPLKAELGLGTQSSLGGGVEGEDAATAVIDAISDNFILSYIASANGGLVLEVLQEEYGELLSLPEAEYQSVSRKGSVTIPWLRWLLLEGTRRVVTGADFVQYARKYSVSRTGGALMRKTGSHRGQYSARRGDNRTAPVVGWSVPGEHAGTAGDNFLTRAISGAVPELADLMARSLENF